MTDRWRSGAGCGAPPDLDVDPSAVLRLPIAHHSVALALDGRERMLGVDRPGSGVALTLASDF